MNSTIKPTIKPTSKSAAASIVNRRRFRLAAATTLVLTGIGATAGCAAQAVPVSDVSVAPPSALYTTAPQASDSSVVSATPTNPAVKASASPTAVPSQVVAAAVEDCGQGAALTRPAALVLACADQGLWAKELTWSGWSGTSATATGIISWHVCTPDCAQSTKWDSTSAQVTLTDPVSEPGGRILFTKLELRVTGPTPAGFSRVATYDMAPMS